MTAAIIYFVCSESGKVETRLMDKAWTTTILRKYLSVEVEVGMQRDEGPFKVKDLIDRFHHLCCFLSACLKRFHLAKISRNFELLCIKSKAEQTLQSIHIHEDSMEASKHVQTSRIMHLSKFHFFI